MVFQKFNPGDEDQFDGMRDLFGPSQVDHAVQQAIQMCWTMLPKDNRSIDELERQLRRIVDRAIENLREDGEAFGFSDSQKPGDS